MNLSSLFKTILTALILTTSTPIFGDGENKKDPLVQPDNPTDVKIYVEVLPNLYLEKLQPHLVPKQYHYIPNPHVQYGVWYATPLLPRNNVNYWRDFNKHPCRYFNDLPVCKILGEKEKTKQIPEPTITAMLLITITYLMIRRKLKT
jgi:hypothetical protein